MSPPNPLQSGLFYPVDNDIPVEELLRAYVETNLNVISLQEPRVRDNEPDAVHKMRVALRRLRSVLGAFRSVAEPDEVQRIRGELKWLAACLGEARDLQVIDQRLAGLIDAERLQFVVEPMSARLDERFASEYKAARVAGLAALDDGRYLRLLKSLAEFLQAPLPKSSESVSTSQIVPGLIERRWKRTRSRVRDYRKAPAGSLRDVALHEVRKSLKQLRYLAEAVPSSKRKTARRLIAAAEEMTTILGQHQDSVVTRELLVRWSAEAVLRGENGFSYGRLHAIEEHAARAAEEGFRLAWNRFPDPFRISG